MIEINRIYGTLTNGLVSTSDPGYRYSNVKPSEEQWQRFKPFMSTNTAAKADLILRLLKSTTSWVKILNKLDPVNTYDVLVTIPELTDSDITFESLYKWACTLPAISNEYTTQVGFGDDKIDVVISRLLGNLSI